MAMKTEQQQNQNPLDMISLPWRTRFQLTCLNLITDSVRRKDGTINRRVMSLLDRHTTPDHVPRNAVSSHDVTVDPARNLWFRLFVPHHPHSSSDPLPVVVFFHGGGFAFLSAASRAYDAVCRRFSRKLNAIVCSVEYRLAPEHKCPSQYDDGFDVLAFLDDDDNRRDILSWPHNADVSRCFLAGDSAGGNIAHHVSVRAAEARSSARFSALRVIGLINIQPFFGGKERAESEIQLEGAPVVSAARTQWLWRAVLPDGLDSDCWAVNVSGPNGVDISRVEHFPPTIVFIGGFDPLKDWQRRYYEWVKRSGKEVKLVEYPNAIHAFYVFPELPDSALLFSEVKDFMNNQCSKIR